MTEDKKLNYRSGDVWAFAAQEYFRPNVTENTKKTEIGALQNKGLQWMTHLRLRLSCVVRSLS